MNIKQLSPWNWFNKENESSGSMVPIRRPESGGGAVYFPEGRWNDPFQQLHREMDRLFENTLLGVGFLQERGEGLALPAGLLRPSVDIAAGEKSYTISVEVPGVEEKDVKVEMAGDTLTISGEKKHEGEEKEKNYYRMERSYGLFQRVLTLPEDTDRDGVSATFKNGVLTINIPRLTATPTDVKQIEIKSGK